VAQPVAGACHRLWSAGALGHRSEPLHPSDQEAGGLPLLAPLPRAGLARSARRPPDRSGCRARFHLAGRLEQGRSRRRLVFPSSFHGYVFGDKVHVLLDRAARLPLFFLLSPANKNDLPFAYSLLWFGRFVLALPIHGVRADGAYWGKALVHFIVTILGAHPIIPFNRKKQPLARVRHLVYWPLSYRARAGVPFGPERFFAAAKRYYGLDTTYRVGGDAVLLQVTRTFCTIMVAALVAHELGRPDLRLSPTRVLAHYLPVQEAL
jgi:hypothetical protein